MKRGPTGLKEIYVLMAAMLLFFLPTALQAGYVNISGDTLKQWMINGTNFDFLLIDVMNVNETDSIIATEVCRPYKLPWNPGDSTSIFMKTMNQLPKDTAIIVYCRSGTRSKQAAQALSSNGFASVFSLNGGIMNWIGPLKPTSYIKPTSDLPKPSMLKITAACISSPYTFEKQDIINLMKNSRSFFIASEPSAGNTLYFYNMQGKCVLKKQNPFLGSNDYILKGMSDGCYLTKLQPDKSGNALAIRIMRF